RILDIINQAELIKNFSRIPSDFNKFLFCQLISEIILKTNLEGAENAPLIFKLLYSCFNGIDLTEQGDIYSQEKIGLFFISKFLKITGYPPLISVCSKCGLETERRNLLFFSIRLGGMLCRKCSSLMDNYPDLKKPLSGEKLEFMALLFSASLKDFKKTGISKADLDDTMLTIGDYMRYHTGCNIDVSLYLKGILP
ncbi:MAG: DNA repair protein RecO, partial [Actinobacteria bacterium]|nr:DNA repair protein RecO [Actinomycetota bacterium]